MLARSDLREHPVEVLYEALEALRILDGQQRHVQLGIDVRALDEVVINLTNP